MKTKQELYRQLKGVDGLSGGWKWSRRGVETVRRPGGTEEGEGRKEEGRP